MPHKIKPPSSIASSGKWPFPIVVGLFISVCLFFLSSFGLLQPLTAVLSRLFSPLFPVQHRIVTQMSLPWRWVQFTRYGTQQIVALEQQLAERTTKLAEAEFLRQENQDLRAQLSALSSQTIRDQQILLTVPARVVTAGGMLGIDQGATAGIQSGDVVFSRGFVVGRLVTVGEYFSQFGLISQGNAPILVKTNTGVIGVLTGKDDQLLLKEVATGQDIKIGDRLYTVGSVDENIPPGLIAGEVQNITQSPQSAVNDILVTQPGNTYFPSIVVVQRFGKK